MKALFSRFLMIATIIGVFTACSSEKENYLSSIPAESSMVIKVNATQLVNKSNILNNPLVGGLLMQAEQSVPDALKAKFEEIKNNPEASGVDLQKPLAIALDLGDLDITSAAGVPNVSVVGVLPIKDIKKFEELLNSVSEVESTFTISETEGVKRINIPEEEFSVAYNSSRLVMAYGKGTNAVSLVSQQEKESMLAHPDFAEFAANDKDASLFMDYEWMMNLVAEAQKNMGAPASVSPQLMEYLKGMNVYGTLNFETGKVVGDMKVYLDESARKYMETFYLKPSGKLVGLIPADSYLGFNFAVKNYSECLKFLGEEVRQQIEELLAQYGLSEELIDNVHGDILLAMYQGTDNPLIPNFVVAVQCKDRTLFDKVKELMQITTEGDMFDLPNQGYRVSFVDNVLIVSTKGLYNQCLASGSIKAWDKSWKGTPMGDALSKGGIAIDFQAISKNPLLQEMADNRDGAMTLSILKQLETLSMQMESMQETTTELSLTNKNKNALEQLIAIGIGAAMAR